MPLPRDRGDEGAALVINGSAVMFKRRPGLGTWTRGTLVRSDGRRCTVRDRAGALHEVVASRVRLTADEAAQDRIAENAEARRGQRIRKKLKRPTSPAPSSSTASSSTTSAPARRSVFHPMPKSQRIRSDEYLAFVRTHPCCACGAAAPSDPHHVKLRGEGSLGLKTHDVRTVPLCRADHDEVERAGFIEKVAARDRQVPPRRATSSLFETVMVSLFIEWWQRGGAIGEAA